MSTKAFSLSILFLGFVVIGSTLPVRAQAKFTAPTAWVPKSVAYVKASNPAEGAQFGYEIAMSGDGNTMAVGSINESSGAKGINGKEGAQGVKDSGAVYVYVRKNGAWAQQAYVKASNPKEEALFGSAVALSNDGNTMAVAAYLENSSATGVNGNQMDTGADSAGAVYVFSRSGTTWTQQAYVKASNTGEGDQFGFSVALSGDGNTLAAGAIEEASRATGVNGDQKDDSQPGNGAAYVFSRTGTTWSQQAYTKADTPGGLFGYGVGLSGNGDTLAVGDENSDAGFVYAFQRTGTTWAKQGVMAPVNGENSDNLGWCVAISADGNTIVAGANDEDSLFTGVPANDLGAHDVARDASVGAAYVFTRDASGKWAQQVWFKAINARKNDQYGTSIAISADGNTVAVGSMFGAGAGGSKGVNADPNDETQFGSGSAYLYTRSGNTWVPAAYVKAPNARTSAQFGNSVALSADGKTLAVGSFRETSGAKGVNGNEADTSAPEAGAVYIYY